MVNRVNTQKDGEREKLARQNVAAAINYSSETPSSTRSQPKSSPPFDDLIMSLVDAHENRRARQVTEWERMRQQHFPLSV